MSDKTEKFFSIVTVTLNCKEDLIKTIISLRKQKFKNFEYIIIDGGSSDGTLEVIKSNLDIIDNWKSEKDKGIYDAMNKGIDLCNGRYIGMLNAGDQYTNDGLKIIYSHLVNKNLDFIFGPVMKKILKYGFRKYRIFWNFDFYSSHSSGFFIKASSQRKLGYYNLKYKISSDYDLFFRMIVKKKMKGISSEKNKLVGIFKSGTSYSSKFSFLDHLFEETQIRLDNSQNKLFVFFLYIIHILKNKERINKKNNLFKLIKNFFNLTKN